MIKILYTKISTKPPQDCYEDYLFGLPADMQEDNLRFVQLEDRLRHLCGKLLLREALGHFGFGNNCLHQLYYNEYKRPYISEEIDFNISHSGAYVFCAIGRNVKLGIDVEEVKQVDLSEFNQVMTKQQWQDIHESATPHQSFFSYWTIKESVIKGESRGLFIPLQEIQIDANTASYQGHQWYLKQINPEDGYCACLACNKEQEIDLQLKEFW